MSKKPTIDPTDDTVRTGRQAEEDVFTARMDDGQFGQAFGLEGQADVDRLYEKIGTEGADLVFYRVPYEVSQRGELGGRSTALVFQDMPAEAHGKVMLMFDGYADDPRELFEIPVVVEFVRGILMGEFGTPEQVDPAYVRKLFQVLYDEWAAAADEDGNLVDPERLKPCGSCWVVAMSFHEHVYFREGRKWLQDWSLTLKLREHLQEGAP